MKFNLKALAAAAALAATSTYGVAGPASTFDADTLTFGFANVGIGSNVSVSDTFSLMASDLTPGIYSILGTFSGTNFSVTGVTVNGTPYDIVSPGPKFAFGTIDYTGVAPLTVNVTGFTSGKSGAYSGELVLTAVPEPETYALMLGGLGALGFLARRRRNV